MRSIKITTVLITFAILSIVQSASAQLPEGETNPLFTQAKVKNYLPHMTWSEVEEALKTTDMVIIPVGSTEQHGKHLPLGTDMYLATELAKIIAQEADVLVAPAVYSGLSKHHMGFPGSLTLSPETFEAVVYETALSLIEHGFKKIMLLNGHGGNNTSVANIIQKINQNTSAVAMDIQSISVPDTDDSYSSPDLDWHAGVSETSLMMYMASHLVQMDRAENPKLTFSSEAQKIMKAMKSGSRLGAVRNLYLFRPLDTGKKASSREMSSNGVFTTGDIKEATAARGKWEIENFIAAAVKFIEEWKKI